MHRLAGSIALAVSVTVAAPSFALADDAAVGDPAEQAQTFFEEGAELYARERYAESAKALAKSYALNPRPEVLFAWGQAERLAGNCGEATRIYQRYLETDPAEREREHTHKALELCETDEPEPQTAPPPPPELDESAAAEQDAGDDEPPPRRRGPHGTSTALLVSGSVLAVGGIASLVVGGVIESRARNADTYQDYEQRRDPDSGRARGALPAYAAGGVLTAAGVGLIVGGVLLRKRESEPGRMSARPSALSIDPFSRSVSITWRLGPR